jgi:hypothetical protein
MTPGGKPPDDTEVILSRNVSDADRLTKRPRTPVTRPPRPASNRRPRFSFFSFTCQRTERQNPSSAKDRSPRKIRRPCTPRPAETGHRTAEDRPAASSRQRKPPSSFTPRTYGSETRRPQDQMSSVEDPIRSASRSYPRPVTRTLQSPRVQRQNRPPAPRRRSAAVDGRVIGPPFRGVKRPVSQRRQRRRCRTELWKSPDSSGYPRHGRAANALSSACPASDFQIFFHPVIFLARAPPCSSQGVTDP